MRWVWRFSLGGVLLALFAGSGSAQWTYLPEVTLTDPAQKFGHAVEILEDFVFVAAPEDTSVGVEAGSVRAYRRRGEQWVAWQTLVGSDVADGHPFGTSMAADGNQLVVGCPRDWEVDVGAGAAYVFERQGDSFSETQKLLASDGLRGDRFGTAVALFGDRLAVGADSADAVGGLESGVVYVFRRESEHWIEEARLEAPDGFPNQRFGQYLSLRTDCGTKLAVGVPLDDDLGQTSGSCYLFELTNGAWIQTAKLHAPRGYKGDAFGQHVALTPQSVFVSSPFEGSAFSFPIGVLHEFSHQGTWMGSIRSNCERQLGCDFEAGEWGIVAIDDYRGTGTDYFPSRRLMSISGDPEARGREIAHPGTALAATATTSVLGDVATGTVWIQERLQDACEWTIPVERHRELVDADQRTVHRVVVADDQSWFAVGSGPDQYGHVSVYRREAGHWTFDTDLWSGDGAGRWLATSGNRLFVAATWATVNGWEKAGKVLVFERDAAGNWTRTAEILRPLPGEFEFFGEHLAASGDLLAVSTHHNFFTPGEVETFRFDGNDWVWVQTLSRSDSNTKYFGTDLALEDTTLAVGLEGDRAVTVFEWDGSAWGSPIDLVATESPQFGRRLALDGDLLVVAANTTLPPWSAVFQRTAGAWTQVQTLEPPLPFVSVIFDLDLDGDWLCLGDALGRLRVSDEGVARRFLWNGTRFEPREFLVSETPFEDRNLAARVALAGRDTVVVSEECLLEIFRSRLAVAARPNTVLAGQEVELHACRGVPGSWLEWWVVGMDDRLTRFPLAHQRFGARGEARRREWIPPALAGHSFELAALGRNEFGNFEWSEACEVVVD